MIVYCITNGNNGKVYIGQTTRHVELRMEAHRRCAKGPAKYRQLIQRAIAKHGWEAFRWEVLEVCVDQIELDMAEKTWIGIYDSMYPNGYNLDSGGKAGRRLSHKTRTKMGLGRLGQPGISYPGERNSRAKLTWAKVDQIRHQAGNKTEAQLALEYGVARPTIYKLLAGDTWREADRPK